MQVVFYFFGIFFLFSKRKKWIFAIILHGMIAESLHIIIGRIEIKISFVSVTADCTSFKKEIESWQKEACEFLPLS